MIDSQVSNDLDTLCQLMADRPFVVLTGAGISTPSGRLDRMPPMKHWPLCKPGI
jgi:NAD-dependent SIR2 family protein deacetylase